MSEFRPESDEVAGAGPDSGGTTAGPLSFAGLTDFMGRQAKARPEGDELAPGSCVGDVRIVRLIGAGGMGCVYEGLQESTQRPVAVKVIRWGLASFEASRRFVHEARILGQLSHPGIARIYAAGVARLGGRETPYFVMELVERPRSITAYADEELLSRPERVELFHAACLAVAHGHERGIVHRDLKPGNMLVTAAGQPKIIDFGVARCSADERQLTTMHTGTGELLGTAQYMAPEQLFGTNVEIDARTDVYALGLVLYELLTGALPYDVRDRPVYEVARIVREAEPRSLVSLDRRLRGDLTAIVASCLDKDLGRRYPSAAALAADVARHLAGQPIVARPPGLAESLSRLAVRHRAAAVGAAAMLVTLVMATVGMTILAARADQARAKAAAAADLATQQLYRADIRSMQSFLEARNVRAARSVFNLDDKRGEHDLRLEFRCLMAQIDDALVVLEPTGDPVVEVAFARDDERLDVTTPIFRRQPERFPSPDTIRFHEAAHRRVWRRTPVRTTAGYRVGPGDRYERIGAPADDHRFAHSPPIEAGRVVAAAGGRSLAVAPDGRVMLRPVGGGAEIPLGDARLRLNRVEFAPGGERVAILAADGRLELWASGDGSFVAACSADAQIETFSFSPDGSHLAVAGFNQAANVRVFETASGTERMSLHVPEAQGRDSLLLCFSPDGRKLAVCGGATDIDVWSVAEAKLERTLAGGAAVVTALAWDRAGDRIASGERSGRICLWEAATGRRERFLFGHDADVLALDFSADGSRLVSGSMDGTARIWATSMARSLDCLPLADEPVAIALRPDGRELAVATAGGDVEVWRTREVQRRLVLPADGLAPASLRYSPDGSLLAVAGGLGDPGGRVSIYDLASGRETARLEDAARATIAAVFSGDNSRVLTTSATGGITLWSPDGPRQLWQKRAVGRNQIFEPPALFGLEGEVVACMDPALLDAATGATRTVINGGQVSCLEVSRDGRLAAFGLASGVTLVFDFASGRSQGRLAGYSAPVLDAGFARDGSRLVTGSADGTAGIWDLASGERLHQLEGHEAAVAVARFTPDARRVVTAATDGTIRIWDADLGDELCTFPLETPRPQLVQVSPDNAVLVTPGSDAAGFFLRLRGLSNAAITAARLAAPVPSSAAP